MNRDRRDEGGIVVGWLVRLLVLLAVVGVVGFDLISVGVLRATAPDQAGSAARVASSSWRADGDVQRAYDAALRDARASDPGNEIETATFRVDPDATVHLVLRRTSDTVLLTRVDALAEWAEVRADASARAES